MKKFNIIWRFVMYDFPLFRVYFAAETCAGLTNFVFLA